MSRLAPPLPPLVAVAVAAVMGGCVDREPSSPVLRFDELDASQTGLDLVTVSGTDPSTEILEVNGSGLTLLDHDGDGDLDLFAANGATIDGPARGPGSRLYENLGGLKFRDATADAGLDLKRWATGAAAGDYDGDGDPDLYVACYGVNALLRNDAGVFVEVTESAGVGDDRWGTTPVWGDFDGDDDLDLYVVNYLDFDVEHLPPPSRFKGVPVMAGPNGLPAQHDVLYENLGDGTFRDVTVESGCVPSKPAYGLGAVVVDFDDDGRPDILVGNDSMANFFFRNVSGEGGTDGSMRFEEVGVFSGLAANTDGQEQATMGIAVGDVDGNGRPDVFSTNFSSDTNTLQLNLDGRFFEDRTMRYGLGLVSRPFLGWSCGFFDFDHDGDEDLLMVNGHVYPQATMALMDSDHEQEPLLFERDGDRFARVTDPDVGSFLAEKRRDRSAAFADLDDDGDVDVVVGELNGPIRILANRAADEGGGEWLIVEPRPALGARVTVTAGDRKWRRWVFSGGYQSGNAPSAHFGLPPGTGPTVLVEIDWPTGRQTRITDVDVNQRFVVTRD